MTLQGQRQLEARLKAIGATQPLMRVMQLATIAEAKKRVHRQSGFLAKNILPGPLSADSAAVVARTPYAAAEELGRGPVTIKPKRARMLSWPAAEGGKRLSGRARTKGGKPAGQMIFATVVHQKARKGHPYLVPAARAAIDKFRDALVARWNGAA